VPHRVVAVVVPVVKLGEDLGFYDFKRQMVAGGRMRATKRGARGVRLEGAERGGPKGRLAVAADIFSVAPSVTWRCGGGGGRCGGGGGRGDGGGGRCGGGQCAAAGWWI
jgi:hypothetical protein